MKKLLNWMLAAILICGASVFTACSNDTSDNPVTPIQPRQRVIAFEGIVNARDMGSLVMQDGRTVRFDMLIRSANLSEATDADVAILKEQYHLSDVFDFRSEGEYEGAPDRFIDGVSYTHLPTLSMEPKEPDPNNPGQGQADGPGPGQMDPSDRMAFMIKEAFNPDAQEMARELYPTIVTSPVSQSCYGEFLRDVLNAKGGVLWHCSQGKDRAGWASAFVLAALGAGRDVIVNDFDLSNQSYASEVEAMSALVRDMEGGDEAMAFIRAMVGVSRENFEATLDLIDQQYGSMSQYIENQLGFSKKEQQQLRDKYLTNK